MLMAASAVVAMGPGVSSKRWKIPRAACQPMGASQVSRIVGMTSGGMRFPQNQ